MKQATNPVSKKRRSGLLVALACAIAQVACTSSRDLVKDEVELVVPITGAMRTASTPRDDHCTTDAVAILPFGWYHGLPQTAIEINHRNLMMIVDTGAMTTTLSPRAVAALDAHEVNRRGAATVDATGRVDYQPWAMLRSIRFGKYEFINHKALIGGIALPGHDADADAPQGLIGADLLARYDVEFDFPGRVIRLYDERACRGHIPAWTEQYETLVPDRIIGNTFVIRLGLDGHPVDAVIDTGASISVMSESAAARAGVATNALANDVRTSSFGVHDRAATSHLHPFNTLEIGSVMYSRPLLSVMNAAGPGEDVLLGTDVLRRGRLWMSYSTKRVFIEGLSSDQRPFWVGRPKI
ncbi:retroviral-like aspartic protease family protein [Burkholderia sp. Ac-20365]|jgi:predicted aspartyl protease|uniref:retroviral-like aspartic protease family protein n=1 Tax=Burkholderia sp. Ac-20365 TaxID=2703897 RepID=UPI00197C8F05|nr:retroviral-like aspartic protease family protein [Burkholderia sp. Ac-20365]MBN3759478.1 hypothetical protein [Burkholderia sp. Ac-20365]